MYGSIHISDLSMVLTMRLILGFGRTSQIISRVADVSVELASFARESACAFWDLGIWTNVNLSNFLTNSFTCCKYIFMPSSLASNSPFTCSNISWKSEKVDNIFAPASWQILSPMSNASYSASLLEAANSNLTLFPYGPRQKT